MSPQKFTLGEKLLKIVFTSTLLLKGKIYKYILREMRKSSNNADSPKVDCISSFEDCSMVDAL